MTAVIAAARGSSEALRPGGSATMRRMSSALEQAIAQLPLYRRLQADDRVKLAAVSTLESFPRASQIFREGDLARSVHVVVETRNASTKTPRASKDEDCTASPAHPEAVQSKVLPGLKLSAP